MSVLDRGGAPVLADRAALAARVAPPGGSTAESMRQATRRAERHVARLLGKVRRSSRLGAARQMIAAEGLAAVGVMIARYRGGGRFTTDYEIARITVALRDLRVRDDAWARMDPAHAEAHLRLWLDVVRRAQPGHVAAPASLRPWRTVVSLRSWRVPLSATTRVGFQRPGLPVLLQLYGLTWLGRCASARPVRGTGRDGSAGRGSADR